MRLSVAVATALVVTVAILAPAFAQYPSPSDNPDGMGGPGRDGQCGHRENGTCTAGGMNPGADGSCGRMENGTCTAGGMRGDDGCAGHRRCDAMRNETGRMEDRWNRIPAAARDRILANAERHHLFGKFAYDATTGAVTGRYVTFTLDAVTGALRDVVVHNPGNATTYAFFSSVTPTPFTADGSARVTGSVLHVPGTNVSFMAHNNPTATLQYRADAPTDVTFTLAAGTSVLLSTAHEVQVRSLPIHGHILLHGNGTLAATNSTVTAHLAAGDSLQFVAHTPGIDATWLHTQNLLFQRGTLGTNVRVAAGSGTEAGEDESPQAVDTQTTSVAPGRVVLNISSAQHGAQVLFLTLDGAAIAPADAAHADVILGSEHLVRLPSIDAVVNAPGHAAWIQADNATGTTQVVVRVAHFSSYALTIASLGQATGGGASSTPASTPGATTGAAGAGSTSGKGSPPAAVGLAAVALVAAAVALRRRVA